MRRGGSLVLTLGCAAALAGGCGDPTPAPDVAARIGGTELRYQDFELYLEQNSVEQDTGLGSEVLSRLFDRFLEEELLLRLAVDSGWVPPGASRRAAVRHLLERSSRKEISAREVERYYRAHQGEFRRPERVRLRQILLDSREAAERARAAWESGVAFEQLVGESGDQGGAFQGGEQELARDDLPAVFAETVFALEPGEVSEVVAADYGYHLFQVVGRRPAELVPIAEAAAEIRERLRGGLADEEVESVLRQARERYNVEVFGRNIPFNYDGDF